VFNDLNGSLGNPEYSGTVKTGLSNLIKHAPNIAIAPGDIVSGEDFKKAFSDNDFKKMWDSFSLNIHGKLKAAGIPFAPSPGNHDANSDLPREVTFYKNYFDQGQNIPNISFVDRSKYPFYYSYIVGNVFFIALDDTQTYKLDANSHQGLSQKAWIKAELDSPEAKSAAARIVYGHIPLYSVLNKSKHAGKYEAVLSKEQYGVKNPGSLEEILINGNVSLTIFAHSHSFYPGIVSHKGAARAQPMLFSPCMGPGSRYLNGNNSSRSPEGYSIIDVAANGKLTYTTFNYKGEVLDSKKLPSQLTSNNGVIIRRDDVNYRMSRRLPID
jgi:acid phosphatase type 7